MAKMIWKPSTFISRLNLPKPDTVSVSFCYHGDLVLYEFERHDNFG